VPLKLYGSWRVAGPRAVFEWDGEDATGLQAYVTAVTAGIGGDNIQNFEVVQDATGTYVKWVITEYVYPPGVTYSVGTGQTRPIEPGEIVVGSYLFNGDTDWAAEELDAGLLLVGDPADGGYWECDGSGRPFRLQDIAIPTGLSASAPYTLPSFGMDGPPPDPMPGPTEFTPASVVAVGDMVVRPAGDQPVATPLPDGLEDGDLLLFVVMHRVITGTGDSGLGTLVASASMGVPGNTTVIRVYQAVYDSEVTTAPEYSYLGDYASYIVAIRGQGSEAIDTDLVTRASGGSDPATGTTTLTGNSTTVPDDNSLVLWFWVQDDNYVLNADATGGATSFVSGADYSSAAVSLCGGAAYKVVEDATATPVGTTITNSNPDGATRGRWCGVGIPVRGSEVAAPDA
jgi:hypothetical protein